MQKAAFEDILEREGKLLYKVKGTSMLPLLHQDRDLVILEKPEKAPEIYDVVLYKRGGRYVLHRIVAKRDDGYVIRGDNTFADETGVREEDILAVLTGYVRHGKKHTVTEEPYKAYVRLRCASYPLRRLAEKCLRRAGQLLK